MADAIVKRLFENKKMLSTRVFNVEDHADEAYDLMDTLEDIVSKNIKKMFDDVDMDDTGMNSSGDRDSDRNIFFIARTLAHWDDKKEEYVPLTTKEWNAFKEALAKEIMLPAEDEEYEYEVDFSYSGKEFIISLKRYRI